MSANIDQPSQFDAACCLYGYGNETQPAALPALGGWSAVSSDAGCLYPFTDGQVAFDHPGASHFQANEVNGFQCPMGYPGYSQGYPANACFTPHVDFNSGLERSSQWSHHLYRPAEAYQPPQLSWTDFAFTQYPTVDEQAQTGGDATKKMTKRERDAKKATPLRVNASFTSSLAQQQGAAKRGRKPKRLVEPASPVARGHLELPGREAHHHSTVQRTDSNCSLTNDLEGFALNNHVNLPVPTARLVVVQPSLPRP